MSFNSDTINSLFLLFESKSFLYFKNGKFYFLYGVSNSFKGFLNKLNSPTCFKTEALKAIAADIILNDETIENRLMEVIKAYSENNKPKEIEGPKMGLLPGEINLADHMRTLVPVVNVTPKAIQKVLILDPNNGFKKFDIDPETYFLAMGVDSSKFLRSPQTQYAILEFNPYSIESYYRKPSYLNGMNLLHINTYIPPKWKLRTDIEGKFTGRIRAIFEHLFPVAEELEYVLDWFHHSLISRAETVLCLIGARGTGKGVVCSGISEALHGSNYFQIAKQEILTDKFNGEFKDRRFVYFDEIDITGDRELTKFKAFSNNKIAMEKKGSDSQTIDNYASMALSSNYKNKFRVEAQERRFSVPAITDVPLNKIFSEHEIGEFLKDILDPDSDEIAEFGHFLLNRVPKYSSQTPLKGDYFMELCRLNLSEWKLFLIDYVIENGEEGKLLFFKDIRKAFNKINKDAVFPTKQASYETFLDDYKHKGKYRIGTFERAKNENYKLAGAIMPDSEFITLFGDFCGDDSDNPLSNL